MHLRKILTLLALGMSTALFAQGTITTFRVDGLIISKARYDPLRITRSQILKIRSMPPSQAVSVYGSRGSAGVAEISTSKMAVVKSADGTAKSAIEKPDKEKLLSSILESQILMLRNIDAQALKSEFGLDNKMGALVVYLRF